MDFHHIMMLIHHNLYDSYKLYYCPFLCYQLYPSIFCHIFGTSAALLCFQRHPSIFCHILGHLWHCYVTSCILPFLPHIWTPMIFVSYLEHLRHSYVSNCIIPFFCHISPTALWSRNEKNRFASII